MSYNLDAIKRKIEDLSGGPKSNKKDQPKLTWFKPSIGSYNIRFLPYSDADNQPVQQVSYYDNKLLHEYRFVAPAQFGLEDPIFELLNELRKERSKETWRIIGTLRPKERFYAPILVRGEEGKGVQIWEMNAKLLKDLYSILAHPDYADENLFDPSKGYDFTLDVTDSGKKWNGYVIKEYKFTPRRNPSKLVDKKDDIEKLVSSVPNLEEYFKNMVRSPEWLNQTVENFLSAREKANYEDGDEEENDVSAKTKANNRETSRGGNAVKNKTTQSIEDAFSDLDDDDIPF